MTQNERYRLIFECSKAWNGFEPLDSRKQMVECDFEVSNEDELKLTETEILTLLYNRMYDYLEEEDFGF